MRKPMRLLKHRAAWIVLLLICATAASEAQKAAVPHEGAKTSSVLGRKAVLRNGVEQLTATPGVDLSAYLSRWHQITMTAWTKAAPGEVNPPRLQSGVVKIRFKILPDGKIMPGSLEIEARASRATLDTAAWKAIADSAYPPLPRAFHGPYLELRSYFFYNMTKR